MGFTHTDTQMESSTETSKNKSTFDPVLDATVFYVTPNNLPELVLVKHIRRIT